MKTETITFIHSGVVEIPASTKPQVRQLIQKYLENPDVFEAWEAWVDKRASNKKAGKVTPRSVVTNIKTLDKICRGNLSLAIDVIDQSENNGWTGFWPLINNFTENTISSGKKTTFI